MKIAVATFAIAVSLLGYSATLPAYYDKGAYDKAYDELAARAYSDQATGEETREFYELRKNMLTPKYLLDDYGCTLLVLSVVAAFVFRKKHFLTPSKLITFIALAIVSPFLSYWSGVYDLYNSAYRGDFPMWADSLGIPLASIYAGSIFLLGWALFHLLFLWGVPRRRVPVSQALSLKGTLCLGNLWLMLMSTVCVASAVFSAWYGSWFTLIAGLLWLYFFASMIAIRSANREHKAPVAINGSDND